MNGNRQQRRAAAREQRQETVPKDFTTSEANAEDLADKVSRAIVVTGSTRDQTWTTIFDHHDKHSIDLAMRRIIANAITGLRAWEANNGWTTCCPEMTDATIAALLDTKKRLT